MWFSKFSSVQVLIVPDEYRSVNVKEGNIKDSTFQYDRKSSFIVEVLEIKSLKSIINNSCAFEAPSWEKTPLIKCCYAPETLYYKANVTDLLTKMSC